MDRIFGKHRDQTIGSKGKSLKKRIEKVLKFGSKSNSNEPNDKIKSSSVKIRFKSFLSGEKAEHSDERKWLLHQSSTHFYSPVDGSEGDNKDKKIKNQQKKKSKETKDSKESEKKKKKNKSLVKRVGKITVQTCRYISMSGSPGYGFHPSSHYNYETQTYDYYPHTYSDAQSCSPSMFF